MKATAVQRSQSRQPARKIRKSGNRSAEDCNFAVSQAGNEKIQKKKKKKKKRLGAVGHHPFVVRTQLFLAFLSTICSAWHTSQSSGEASSLEPHFEAEQ